MPGEFFLILLGELIFIDDHREAMNVNFDGLIVRVPQLI